MALRVQAPRPQCGRVHYHTQAAPQGLRFIPQLVNRQAQEHILQESLNLYRQIELKAQDSTAQKTSTYLSRQHNLQRDEYYKFIRFPDKTGKTLDSQHFEKYGEEGHTLTYFIGTKNVPAFVQEALISPIESLEEVRTLKAQKNPAAPLDWKFTFNTYRIPKSRPGHVPGFDFHIDTPSNGEITAIFTLLSEAQVEMKPDMSSPPTFSATLIPGSLFLLSGDARWNWLHRVIPKKLAHMDSEMIQRISLVLGCK
jgi:hypothetical protein